MRTFLHELSDFQELIASQARVLNIQPQLLEKDYWLMHALWGLQQLEFNFNLKGGTSLSKGFGIIDRFSEDLDIRIEPPAELDVKYGKNQDKPAQIESRLKFYDWVTNKISISGMKAERDTEFDDKDARNAGIRLYYESKFSELEGIKTFVLLEVGFDITTPNQKRMISSWLYDAAASAGVDLIDNRAKDIPCYLPGYTLIEKLDAISRKYLQEQDGKKMPVNFIRHYYDIYKLLGESSVQDFIGSKQYLEHKTLKFSKKNEADFTENEAFILSDPDTRERYSKEYLRTQALYYGEYPSLDEILKRIQIYAERL